jgi:hypothetical protein
LAVTLFVRGNSALATWKAGIAPIEEIFDLVAETFLDIGWRKNKQLIQLRDGPCHCLDDAVLIDVADSKRNPDYGGAGYGFTDPKSVDTR